MTDTTSEWLQPAVDHALAKVRRLAASAIGFPVSTRDGQWQFDERGTWTAGFWPGRLWLAYLLSGDAAFAVAARTWCARLAPHQLNATTHDVGMLFAPSFVLGWRITAERALRFGALAAAETLSARFNPRGRFIRALGSAGERKDAGYVIVDTLMNLPLLYWATVTTGDRRYADIAEAHTETSRRRHIRADGSTWQVFTFDEETAEPVGPSFYQGLSRDSCWSRGQAWAIYGLAAGYAWTSSGAVLADARRVADWWLSHESDDGVPAWDFSALGDDQPKDSSAAAIAACGLLDLDRQGAGAAYGAAACRISRTLALHYTSRDDTEDGILLHATGVKPHGRDVDVSLSYADYFYMELLLRLARPEAFAEYISPRSSQ